MKTDFVTEAIRGTLAVIGATLAALTLNQWVAIITALYIVIQAAYLLRKWWREEKEYAAKRAKAKR